MKKILAPSILSADFKNLGEQIRKTYEAGARFLHFDVMDGLFVPNISFGMPVLRSIKGASPQVMDVHLMIHDPIRYVEAFGEAGADIITVHLEECGDVKAVLDRIHGCGLKAGVSVRPGLPVEKMLPAAGRADLFLIMSVEPGFGGQKFLSGSLEKISRLKKLLAENGSEALIEVDGGISPENARDVLNAGADVLVAGSAVFKGSIEENVKRFMEIFKEYE